MNPNPNPLRQYFRRPSIFVSLPSRGDFWPRDTLSLPPNGEVPVLPMTAIDEITYRTPDALFNGEAVVAVIQSCVPNIHDAWSAPVIDINALLVAIRIASYGHELDVGTRCPSCSTDADYVLDLRTVLENLRRPDFDQQLTFGDLEIAFQPVNYRHQHETNQAQYEQQRMIQMIPASDLSDEEKIHRLNVAMRNITDLTVKALKWSIASVRTPQALVTEPQYIEEWLLNCDRTVFNRIRDHVIGMRQDMEFKPMHIKCGNCGHEYEQALTLDMASFFAPAS